MPRLKMETYSVYKTDNPKFKKYEGLPKISYSALGSFTTDAYRGEFIAQKYLGFPNEGNVFTTFGSSVGTLAEYRGDVDAMRKSSEENAELLSYLSEFDIATIQKLPHSPSTEFEREIVLKRTCKYGDYVIQGFIDRADIADDGSIDVIDYKTGGTKKVDYYSDPGQYMQTRLYAHALAQEGESIGYCGVTLLDRKGMSLEKDSQHPLRLTGEVIQIDTPYDADLTEKWLEGVDKIAEDLCTYHKFMNKFFPLPKN